MKLALKLCVLVICQDTVPEDMDSGASFECLPADLIQRIAASIPCNSNDKESRRCLSPCNFEDAMLFQKLLTRHHIYVERCDAHMLVYDCGTWSSPVA